MENLENIYWLIFLETPLEFKHIFHNISIPYYSEIFIVKCTGNHIIVYEVYHNKPGTELIDSQIAIFHTNKSITMLNYQSKYERRRNLNGTKMNLLIRNVRITSGVKIKKLSVESKEKNRLFNR